MKLVFVTQVLDRRDAVLGFVLRWVEGLARHAERVRVVALEVGDTSGLPDNVDWIALGRRGRVLRYLRYRSALRRSFREGFDGLLTHMVPRYSTVGARWAREAGVPHFLWYTHKGVDARLLRAVEVVDGVFTASDASMRVDTPKKIVTGHGIDARHFDAPFRERSGDRTRLLSVGRLTPSKDPLIVLEALSRLRDEGRDVTLTWAGAALARGDDEYGAMVQRAIEGRDLGDVVHLVGAVPYPHVPELYADADLFVSASRTGSVDKVVLESMASRLPFVSCNESFPPLLMGYEALAPVADDFVFPVGDAERLADRIRGWIDMDPGERDRRAGLLRDLIVRDHEVDRLMGRLVATMVEARENRSGGRRP
ncbi:MAG: glycosyltransferase family 4 protein [Planctomycetota bacterium]